MHTHPHNPYRLLWLPFLAFLGVFFFLLNARYPQIGHDYRLFFPFLLEGRWHILQSGLLPLRFAAHLCGGFPLYGNPNDLFYSLTQLLAVAFSPWHAVQLSVAAMLAAGYAGWLAVGRDVLRLTPAWRHVLALTLSANGFYFSHVTVGHANFFTFPLLSVLFWLLFDRRRVTGPRLPQRAALFALTTAVMLYAGGYYPLLYFALLAALLAPLDLCMAGRRWRQRLGVLAARGALCATLSLLLGISKIVAVAELMTTMGYGAGMLSIAYDTSTVSYIASALWALPQSSALFDGVPWALHEQSQFLSPIVWLGLLTGIGLTVLAAVRRVLGWKWAVLLVHAMALSAVFLQLVQGHGLIADAINGLPGFSSFRVPTRYLYPLSLWLSVIAVLSLASLTHGMRPERIRIGAFTLMTVTVLAFFAAYSPAMKEFELYANDADYAADAVAAWQRGPVEHVTDGDYAFDGYTTRECPYETVFIAAENPQAERLHAGAVTDISDGTYNLANPACYQYGEENGCEPGDLIAAADSLNFERFRRGDPVTWKLSRAQHAADTVTMAVLGAAIGLCGMSAMQRLRSQKKG